MFVTSLDEHKTFRAALASAEYQSQLPVLIRQSLRQPSETAARDFRIGLSFGEAGYRTDYNTRLYFDDPHALTLLLDVQRDSKIVTIPFACVSFHVCSSRSGLRLKPYKIFITQIQGIDIKRFESGYQSHLRKAYGRLRWEALLVHATILLAQMTGNLSEVWIKKARDNIYYMDYSLVGGLSRVIRAKNARLEKRYDETARYCGFEESLKAHVLKI
jgi:hypothetical protein